MRKKKFLSLILCMIFTVLSSSVTVSAANSALMAKVGKNVTSYLYMLDNSLTISGSGDMYDFTNDFSDNGYIAWMMYLTDLTVTDGVTSIGNYAFYSYPKLKNVSLADSIKRIGENAFFCCTALKELKIPINLETLGDWAFCMTEIEKVYIYDLNKWCTVDCGMYGSPIDTNTNIYVNDKLTTDLVIPNSVTTIKGNLFSFAKTLKTVKIPESVTKIEDNAFYSKTILLVHEGSYAHKYAKDNNFTFQTITKDAQNVSVSSMPETTYGDNGFKVEVTNDQNPDLGTFTFESSNTDVATIDENGNVIIKNAGDTNIIVKRGGNATYADFEKSQKLTVKKVALTVTADAKTKKVGTADPELTYTYTGTLLGTDGFTGELKRDEGEEIGKYDILQNTLKINDNYDITYNKATFEILEKTPQNITVADFGEKTYGDGAFNIDVTKDSESNLENFTYSSDNESVATVDESGKITIVGEGEANISVTEAGNDDYAKTTVTKKLTVAKKKRYRNID